MAVEYAVLIIMTIFYLFAWIPSSIGKYKSFGGKWISSNRAPLPDKQLVEWAGRAERAYANLKDYFPGFVVAVLVLGFLGKFDQTTTIAAVVYAVGRVGHMISYIAGSVTFRFIFYLVSIASNLYLLAKCFGY